MKKKARRSFTKEFKIEAVRQVVEQSELAIPGRVLAGVAVAVISEGHRRGQHREDQGVHEQYAAHAEESCHFLVHL